MKTNAYIATSPGADRFVSRGTPGAARGLARLAAELEGADPSMVRVYRAPANAVAIGFRDGEPWAMVEEQWWEERDGTEYPTGEVTRRVRACTEIETPLG